MRCALVALVPIVPSNSVWPSGAGLGDRRCADGTGRPDLVLDDDGFAPPLAQPLRNDACTGVGGGAGRKRRDHLDLLGRIVGRREG